MTQPQTMQEFQETVWSHYRNHARQLPWREPLANGDFDPYRILISEMMLQQTQVTRVIPKYQAFLDKFPDSKSLAEAPLSDVLILWSGLGYNRRAKYLWQAARMIEQDFNGVIPRLTEELIGLPGVGKNTAAAIVAYAYNSPVVFIETNIRTVFIKHFFIGQDNVSDTELLPLIMESLDRETPREWYWALMDYGSYVKTAESNYARSSSHHVRQAAFEGSRRQVRGQVIRVLSGGPQSVQTLGSTIADNRLPDVLRQLVSEEMIKLEGDHYSLTD